MPEDVLETPTERAEAAAPFVRELAKLAPREFTLFGIGQATLELLDFRQDVLERIETLKTPGGFCSEADMEALCDAEAELSAANVELAKLAGQEVAKVDHCANLLRMCDRMIEHRTEERDRQNKSKKRWESIKEAVENIVMEALTLSGGTRFDTPTNTLRMQRNSAPGVDIKNPSLVQDRYINVNIRMRLDRWKQVKTALPDLLPEHYQIQEQTFALSDIAKVLKAAAKADAAPKAIGPGEPPKIERVKGAELRYGRHLRCE